MMGIPIWYSTGYSHMMSPESLLCLNDYNSLRSGEGGHLPVALVVKNLPVYAGDTGLVLGLGRSPGVGSGCILAWKMLGGLQSMRPQS